MTTAIHAEWTKLRTVVSTPWLVLAIAGFTVAVGALSTWSVDSSFCPSPAGCDADTVRLSLTGVYVGQIAVAVLAALAITTEYDTNLIRSTLAADPRRIEVIAAKTTVVTASVLGASLLGVTGTWLAARLILAIPPSLAEEPTLRAYAGTVLYCGLIGLLGLGVGLAVRHTAGALAAVMAILFVSPVVASLISDEHWRERVMKYSPMTAGLAIQATRRLGDLPIGPWAGLGVLAGYAAAALVLGTVLFRLRDA
jgi:ABC-2 type transport system permease protein